ncbi:MAG TPA: Gfo/Idh/MocA family oxidoreductase [Candidatus Latescibacteria bacterium]|nr:Gfo/Idh/MocA family oxidoreductase [Candidatus Latescibacterota bacterium]
MDKVRVGFIGCGFWANTVHYPSLARMDDVVVAAVCDLNHDRLKETASKYGIERSFSDYRQMVEEVELDAVYIVMPPHHLFDLTVDCLNRKLHVFIEKPPGLTRWQTESMARTAERNGCKTMVGFNRRFIPLMMKMRSMVEEKGPITECVATFYKNMGGVEEPYYGGAVDVLTCDAIHAVDTLRWLGGEVRELYSSVRKLHSRYYNMFVAIIQFEGGSIGVLLTNWAAGKRVHTFEMHAKGISAFINPDEEGVIYKDNRSEGITLSTKDAAGSDEFYIYYGYYQENRHFIDCIKEDRLPQTHFGDAVETMELVERIYRTAL